MLALALNCQSYNACIGSKQSVLQCLHLLYTVSVTMPALALNNQRYNACIGFKTVNVTMATLALNYQSYNACVISEQSALQCRHWL